MSAAHMFLKTELVARSYKIVCKPIKNSMFELRYVRLMARQWCLSSVVCLSSVTFVHPTQTVKLFGNIFSPYGSPISLG